MVFSVCKINSTSALDQDDLHACHCAFFEWFNLPCFVQWVTEKQPCLGEEFHFNVNGWEMIQCKNTQMRWQRVEGKQQKGICRRKLCSLEYRRSSVFTLQTLSLKIVRQSSTVNTTKRVAWLRIVQNTPHITSKLPHQGCGRKSAYE